MSFSRMRNYKSKADLEIGDRVKFIDEYGSIRTGSIYGRGAAGNYLQIKTSDGSIHEGYSSDPDLECL